MTEIQKALMDIKGDYEQFVEKMDIMMDRSKKNSMNDRRTINRLKSRIKEKDMQINALRLSRKTPQATDQKKIRELTADCDKRIRINDKMWTITLREERSEFLTKLRDEQHSHADLMKDVEETLNTSCLLDIKRKEHIKELLIKNEILSKKQDKHEKVIESLKKLNVKMTTRLKTVKNTHDREIHKITKSLNEANQLIGKEKERFKNFKKQSGTRCERHHAELAEDRALYDDYISKLEEDSKDYKDQVDTLREYAVLDTFIQKTCEEITGLTRNYNTTPVIYNNLHTLLSLRNNGVYIQRAYNMSVNNFKQLVNRVRTRRNIIAHPVIRE